MTTQEESAEPAKDARGDFTPLPNEWKRDHRLDDVGDFARALYGCILSITSHRGRFPGSARSICRELGFRSVPMVERKLRELEAAQLVKRYTARGAMGVQVVVGRVLRYENYRGLPINRRAPTKIAEMAADPLPPMDGVEEKGWTEAERWDATLLERTTSEREAKAAAEKLAAQPEPFANTKGKVQGKPQVQVQVGEGAPTPTPAIAEVIELPFRKAAYAVTEAHGEPDPQLPLAVETKPFPPQLEPIVRDFTELYEQQKPHLLEKSKHVSEHSIRAELQKLEVLFGMAAIEGAISRIRSEMGELDYWTYPLPNLERCTRWAHSKLPRTRKSEALARRSEQPANAPTVAVETPRLEVVPDEATRDTWCRALAALQRKYEHEPWEFKSWLMPIQVHGRNGEHAVFEVPDQSHGQWLKDNFDEPLRAAWRDAGGTCEFVFQPYAESK